MAERGLAFCGVCMYLCPREKPLDRGLHPAAMTGGSLSRRGHGDRPLQHFTAMTAKTFWIAAPYYNLRDML